MGKSLLREARSQKLIGRSLSELVAWAGLRFLGAPYQGSSLERKGPERLVVNLRSFDCVTFVETAFALALLIRRGSTDFAAFPGALTLIRYRRGRCDGYASRLHYFTDWLHDAGRKDLVRDATPLLGGVPYPKVFSSLTDRRPEHPALTDPRTFRRMRIIEAYCSRRSLSFLPKAIWESWEGKIQGGDLLAVTTDTPGIDVLHVGIAMRDGKELRLLHASSAAGQVVLTEGTVADYLAEKPSRTGLIVGKSL